MSKKQETVDNMIVYIMMAVLLWVICDGVFSPSYEESKIHGMAQEYGVSEKVEKLESLFSN